MKTYKPNSNILAAVTQEVQNYLDRFGGLETLKAYGLGDWTHFIVNQLSYMRENQQQQGDMAERQADTRQRLVKVAALAVVGVMALDERNWERDNRQLQEIDRDQKKRGTA